MYEGKEDMDTVVASLDYDIRFVGQDYIGKEWDGKEAEIRLNKKVCFVPRNHNLSSTLLKNRIRESVN